MSHWKWIVGIGVVLVLGAGIAIVATSGGLGEAAAGDVRSGPAGATAAHVVMQDNTFQPANIEVPANAPATIEVKNAGAANHNFTSEGLRVSTGPMHGGDVMTVTVTVPKGTTQFHCTWHDGMVIQVVGT